MPNEKYKLKSMSKADLKAHRTALIELINEVNEIYVSGPMMGRYAEAKESLNEAKEDLDDVISLKDTNSYKAVGWLRDYYNSLKSVVSKMDEIVGRSDEHALFYKPAKAALNKLVTAQTSVDNTIKDRMKNETEKAKKITDKKFGLLRKRSLRSADNHKAFTGGQPYNTDSPAKYNMGRTSVHNAALGYLLCKGCTPEQIFDSTQLAEEKQAAFREIAGHMNSGTDEDQKWLGKVFVEGLDKIIENVNTIGKTITPEEANLKNQKFVDLILLGHSWHDLTQEMEKCKEGFKGYLRDERKEDPEAYWDRVNTKGYLTQLAQNYFEQAQSAEEIMDPSRKIDAQHELFIRNNITSNHKIKAFFKEREEKPDEPVGCLGGDFMFQVQMGQDMQKLHEKVSNKYDLENITPDQRYGIMDHLLNSDALKNADYEGGVTENKPVTLHGVPDRDTVFTAGAAYGENRDQMIISLISSAEDAQIGVKMGSSQYNDAVKSLKALSRQLTDYGRKLDADEITDNTQKTAVYRKMREQARDAEEKINKYFKRKSDQGLMDGDASPKTQKRINVMKKALAEIQKSRKMFEDMIVSMRKAEFKEVTRQKFIAERAIDDIALKPDGKLTEQEKTKLSNGFAVVTVCDEEIKKIRESQPPKTALELKTHAERRITSKPFKDSMKPVTRNEAKSFVSNKKDFRERFDANLKTFHANAGKRQPAHKK